MRGGGGREGIEKEREIERDRMGEREMHFEFCRFWIVQEYLAQETANP